MDRNVVLICLDTVRKDFFDEYAPRLRAASDVSYEQCRAPSSCTVPSHGSMMTGLLPHEHGIVSTDPYYSDTGTADTFLSELPDYTTTGVSANTYVGPAFGFDDLFDEFVSTSWTRRFPEGIDITEFQKQSDATGFGFYTDFLHTVLTHEHPFKSFTNGVLAHLDSRVFTRLPVPRLLDDGTKGALDRARTLIADWDEPGFAFLNLMDAHAPHEVIRAYDSSVHSVPNTWSSRLEVDPWEICLGDIKSQMEDIENYRELYGAAIDYLDRQVTEFVEDVLETTDRATSVIITADHGENLGYPEDDRLFEHVSSLSEGVLHVPLEIINPPDGYEKSSQSLVSLLDIGELVTGVASDQVVNVARSRVPAERSLTVLDGVEIDDEQKARYWRRPLRCVYQNDRKIVWDLLGECVEYSLDRSRPCWQRKIDEDRSRPAWTAELFKESIEKNRRYLNDEPTYKQDIDAHTKRRLEELGYLDPGPEK